MRLSLFPTAQASRENKKKWLVYEILRYRDYIRLTQTLKILLIMGLVWAGLRYLGDGWLGLVGMVLGLLVFDFHFEMLVFWFSRNFFFEIGEACFDVEAVSDMDFRILMNRVENYVKTKDAVKKEELYKTLEECYDGLRFKTDLKEAFDDIAKKGKEQEKAQGG